MWDGDSLHDGWSNRQLTGSAISHGDGGPDGHREPDPGPSSNP